MSWFNFHLSDFAFAFLSILLEGIPFVLLGTVLSSTVTHNSPDGSTGLPASLIRQAPVTS